MVVPSGEKATEDTRPLCALCFSAFSFTEPRCELSGDFTVCLGSVAESSSDLVLFIPHNLHRIGTRAPRDGLQRI